MLFNTNTWALSPRAIFIRLVFLLALGLLMLSWIDSKFSFPKVEKTKTSMVHQSVYLKDSLIHKPWQSKK